MNPQESATWRPSLVDMPSAGAEIARRAVQCGAGWHWSPALVERHARDGRSRLFTSGGFCLLETSPVSCASPQVRSLWGRGTATELAALLAGAVPVQRIDGDTRDYIEGLSSTRNIRWIEDRRFANYLYDTAEQVNLEGAQFGRRRTYLSSLKRREGRISRGPVDLTAASSRSEILQIDNAWAAMKGSSPTIDDESESLRSSLTTSGSSLLGCGVREDGRLVSFGIFEMVGQSAIAHHVKALSDSAVFAATWQSLFELAAECGAELVNGGYDGGLTGLRKAKVGLRPTEIRANYAAVVRSYQADERSYGS